MGVWNAGVSADHHVVAPSGNAGIPIAVDGDADNPWRVAGDHNDLASGVLEGSLSPNSIQDGFCGLTVGPSHKLNSACTCNSQIRVSVIPRSQALNAYSEYSMN